jgi:hypothetical protein
MVLTIISINHEIRPGNVTILEVPPNGNIKHKERHFFSTP